MSPDRQMIATAVLEGKLGAEHLTWEEVQEIEATVHELIIEKSLDEALARNPASVFSGIENPMYN
jgi:hypothetical protein